MKFTKEKIRKSLLTLASLVIITSMSFTCIACDNDKKEESNTGAGYGAIYQKYPNPNPNAYTQNPTKEIAAANGGKLISFVQRQSQGELVGDSLSVDYQVKAVYTGNCKVREIKSSWSTRADFRRSTQASANASLQLGVESCEAAIGRSVSVEYPSLQIDKYYVSTNGIKEVVYASNYLIYPYKQLHYHTLQNTALVRIDGYAAPQSVSWAA